MLELENDNFVESAIVSSAVIADKREDGAPRKLVPFPIAEVFLLYGELTLDQRLFVLQKGVRGPCLDGGSLARNKLLLTVAAMAEMESDEIDAIDPEGRRRRIAATARTIGMMLIGSNDNDSEGAIAEVTPVTVHAVDILLSLVPDDLHLTRRRASSRT